MLEVFCATFMCSSICARMWYSNTTVSSWPNLVAYQQTHFLSTNLQKHHYIKSTTYHQIWYNPKSTSIEQQGPWDPSNWAHPPRLGRPGHGGCRPKLSKLVAEPCNGGLQTRGLPCCWEIMAYSQWLNHWMKVYYLYGVMVYMVVFQLGLQKLNGYHLYVHVLFHCSFLRWYQTMYQ